MSKNEQQFVEGTVTYRSLVRELFVRAPDLEPVYREQFSHLVGEELPYVVFGSFLISVMETALESQFFWSPGRANSTRYKEHMLAAFIGTYLFELFTFFGRGLQAKMEVRNEGKYLKIREVEIEW